MMKYKTIIPSFFLLLLFSTATYAKSLRPDVILVSIYPTTKTNLQKKEVYLNVSEFLPNGKSKSMCLPHTPVHWRVSSLKKPLNMRVWKGKLSQGQQMTLKMTLVEGRNPPWDPNIIVGVMSLVLKNNQGSLEQDWSIDKGSSEVFTTSKGKEGRRLSLTGYTVEFALK